MSDSTMYESLKKRMHGEVICPTDAGYDQHRRIWNRDVDRYPAAIARCVDEEDVRIAVRFAVEAGVSDVAVRGGGHSYPGLSTCDGGLVIDLGLMTAGRIGSNNRVFLQGGAQLSHLDALTTQIGTAVPAGVDATTGVAGLTLGGGIGSLQRKFGLTCDSLRSVRMVTADGNVVVADDDTEPDLMWGLRGGGGNFGIVTEFEFQSYPVGPYITNFLLYPLDQLDAFSRFYDDYVADLPKDLASCNMNPKLTPQLTQTLRGVASATMPSDLGDIQGEFFAVNTLWVGDRDELETILKPLTADWTPAANIAIPVTHIQIQSMLPELGVPQNRYVRGGFLDSVGQGVLTDCVALINDGRPTISEFVFSTLGGAVAEVAEADTAFCGREAKYLYAIEASWHDPADREPTIQWVRRAYDTIVICSTSPRRRWMSAR